MAGFSNCRELLDVSIGNFPQAGRYFSYWHISRHTLQIGLQKVDCWL